MTRFILGFFGSIFSWLTLAAFMGALTLGAIFWMYSRDLPSHEQLATYQPATISRIYSAQGRLMDEFATERRLYTPPEQIPDLVKWAFISAEDKNFYQHHGYDLRGMVAAVLQAARGGRLRGASTITQQVMKNFLLSSDRSFERKIKELILATRLEQSLNKEQILALYLNEIFLGQNSYGVTAAAQTYFNKTLDQVLPQEAAYLAALAQRPGTLHPVREHDDAIARRDYVLREMRENGFIDAAAYEAAVAAPLLSVQNGDYESFRATLPPRDYFTDEIRRQLSRNFGEDEFFGGGLTIRATVDPDLQIVAAHALQKSLEAYDRDRRQWRGTGKSIDPATIDDGTWETVLAEETVARDITLDGQWFVAVVDQVGEQSLTLKIEGQPEPSPWEVPRDDIGWMTGSFADNFTRGDVVHVRRMTKDGDGEFIRWTLRQVPEVEGAFMAMDVNTGRVIAMQGGFSYQHSVFNRATQATRQPGSSFKPFVYAAALDSGFTPASIIIDAPIEIDTGGGIWRPRNASNKFYGPSPLRTGIEQSRNLMTVRVAQEVGMEVVAAYAERFGVYDNLDPFLANALGSAETTLFKMVAAYAMFANGGERVEPTLVDRVQDRMGRTIYRHDQRVCDECDTLQIAPGVGPRITSNRERVMNAITAYQLTSMLQGVVQRGTAAGAINLPVPTAGKTGTTNDSKDVWFVGFTSNVVAGCYIGYDRPQRLIGGSGGGTCAPVFQRFMTEAVAKFGGGRFRVPPGGHFIKIDRFSGARLPDDATGDYVVAEYFRDGEEPVFGVAFDGGFAMGVNLPLFLPGEIDPETRESTTATGDLTLIPGRADTGSVAAGGLY